MVQKTSFIEEAQRIIEEAHKESIELRLIGAIAFRLHCTNYQHLFEEFGREVTDIDFIALSKQKKEISQLLKKFGYSLRSELLIHEGRYFFIDNETNRKVDVFFDQLAMCHKIDFRKRLTADPNKMTISLADMLLEKLQIVEINEKDLIDLCVLLLEHELGSTDEETININYIAKLLSDDWGFYYTATTNLSKIANFVLEFQALGANEKTIIQTRISSLLEAIESAPKSRKWRLRASVGTRKKWYNDVGETDR